MTRFEGSDAANAFSNGTTSVYSTLELVREQIIKRKPYVPSNPAGLDFVLALAIEKQEQLNVMLYKLSVRISEKHRA